jgi:hypothetical protein
MARVAIVSCAAQTNEWLGFRLTMMQTVGWFISIGFGVLAAACLFASGFFAIRAWALRWPGVSWLSPRLLDRSGLTEAGLRSFKSGWACALGYLLCWLLSVSVGILTGAFIRAGR